MSGQFHAPVALSPGKEPPVPVEQGARWPHSRSGRSGEAKGNLRKKIYASTLSLWQSGLRLQAALGLLLDNVFGPTNVRAVYEGCSESNAPHFFLFQNEDSNVKIERQQH